MKNARHLHVVNATDRSKTSERSTRTTTPFMLRNPFKNTDWILVWIVVMLSGGGVLFLMAMNAIRNS